MVGKRKALRLCPPLRHLHVIAEKSVFVNNSRTAKRIKETKGKPSSVFIFVIPNEIQVISFRLSGTFATEQPFFIIN